MIPNRPYRPPCGYVAVRSGRAGRGSRALQSVLCTAAWIVIALRTVCGGVSIERLALDGLEVGLPAATDRERVISLPAVAGRLSIAVHGGWAGGPPTTRGMRLKYWLEGVDTQWRDAPAEARVFLQFHAADGSVIDSVETVLHGESPDWQGAAETSAFLPHRLSAVAPPLAVRVTAHFLSHGGVEVVGIVGIDEVAIDIESTDGGKPRRHVYPCAVSDQSFEMLAAPAGWTRRGSTGQMAQLRLREGSDSRPILVILDDDPERYGNWSTIEGAPVGPGEQVTLSWLAAHSLGCGGEVMAEYRNLPPGSYFFRGGAFRPGGEPTGHEVGLRLAVQKPWYGRMEVWAAALCSLGGIAYAASRAIALDRVKRRLEQVKREHALDQERARIARDLHDEIGAGLTEIAMQNFWVHRDMEDVAPAATLERVEKARQSAVDLVRSVDAIVWAVNPVNDTLDRFVPYLTHSVEQFLGAVGVPLQIDVPDRLPEAPLAGAARHGLFLAVREAVNNAVKHARPSRVWLAVDVVDGRLRIVVEDDGCGVTPVKVVVGAERSGVRNMTRRVEELGGRFMLAERPGGGTRVVIDVPLAETVPETCRNDSDVRRKQDRCILPKNVPAEGRGQWRM